MSGETMTTVTARIHEEDGRYWADVPDLPGVFAAGDTLDELFASLREGVAMVFETGPAGSSIQLEGALISVS